MPLDVTAALAIPDPPPRRRNQLNVFLTDDSVARLERHATAKNMRRGEAAGRLLELAIGQLADEPTEVAT
jgi:hypothetical protein